MLLQFVSQNSCNKQTNRGTGTTNNCLASIISAEFKPTYRPPRDRVRGLVRFTPFPRAAIGSNSTIPFPLHSTSPEIYYFCGNTIIEGNTLAIFAEFCKNRSVAEGSPISHFPLSYSFGPNLVFPSAGSLRAALGAMERRGARPGCLCLLLLFPPGFLISNFSIWRPYTPGSPLQPFSGHEMADCFPKRPFARRCCPVWRA